MDREILVGDALTEEMLQAGESLANMLESTPMREGTKQVIDALLWLKTATPETIKWQLIIASPGISFYGPRRGYEWVQKAAAETKDRGAKIPFDRIVVVDTDADLITGLRSFFKKQNAVDRIVQYRMPGTFLRPRYFDDAYIYWLDLVRSIECNVVHSEGQRIRNNLHVLVWGKGLLKFNDFGAVGHGQIKMGSKVTAVIDIPIKYGISSGEEVICKPFMPLELKASELGVSNVTLSRKGGE